MCTREIPPPLDLLRALWVRLVSNINPLLNRMHLMLQHPDLVQQLGSATVRLARRAPKCSLGQPLRLSQLRQLWNILLYGAHLLRRPAARFLLFGQNSAGNHLVRQGGSLCLAGREDAGQLCGRPFILWR